MAKRDTPVSIKENNKSIANTAAYNLVVVGDHMEFDKSATEKGVIVGNGC
jgi:hypothetical protein